MVAWQNNQLNSAQDEQKTKQRNFWKVIIILGLIITITIVTVSWLTLNNAEVRTQNLPESKTLLEDKIYSVKEAIQILESNPIQFKNKNIKIKAYRGDSTLGIGCKDYMIIMDKDDAENSKNIYNRLIAESQSLSEAEKNSLRDELQRIPHLFTGPQLKMRDIFPTQYGIYVGHFYDNLISKSCGSDGWKRFVIEKKEKEILSNQTPTTKTEVITSGLVISNGQYIPSPYKVTLQDYTITINDILYEPSTKDQINNITEDTDQQRNNQFNILVSQLRSNKLLIYGGNKYETSISIYSPTIISAIDRLLTSNISKDQKYEELKKMFDNVLPDSAVDDIMTKWPNSRNY